MDIRYMSLLSSDCPHFCSSYLDMVRTICEALPICCEVMTVCGFTNEVMNKITNKSDKIKVTDTGDCKQYLASCCRGSVVKS